jgi:2-polyprenyl-6-methoxyphenol hydroxylase-like FAD-dependent oxidoreductase
MARQVTSATPKYAGRYYLTSNISLKSPFYATAEAMAGTGNYMSMGGRRLVAAMRLGDRSYYTFVGLSLPESWRSDNAALLEDPEALRRKLVTEYLSDWSKTNTDLIAHSDGEFYIWPLYGLAAADVEWQTVPGVALVGDAAHIWYDYPSITHQVCISDANLARPEEMAST